MDLFWTLVLVIGGILGTVLAVAVLSVLVMKAKRSSLR